MDTESEGNENVVMESDSDYQPQIMHQSSSASNYQTPHATQFHQLAPGHPLPPLPPSEQNTEEEFSATPQNPPAAAPRSPPTAGPRNARTAGRATVPAANRAAPAAGSVAGRGGGTAALRGGNVVATPRRMTHPPAGQILPPGCGPVVQLPTPPACCVAGSQLVKEDACRLDNVNKFLGQDSTNPDKCACLFCM
ncbi:hypothetical protein PM082_020020 [Marasmius tenuissimus]|nr:hypothetical protein PM082_020020 [Marasmius tenuissimus]